MPFYCSYCRTRVSIFHELIVNMWKAMSREEWWEYCHNSYIEI